MVVLKSGGSVLAAARAIEKSGVGAVLIEDDRRVVGIVTDRDLTGTPTELERNPQCVT
jgi:CBS domain-containing protein